MVSGVLAHWPAEGYVVLASQYRGAAGSQAADEFGGDDVNDVLALERVATELEHADEDRMVMLGHSPGGMMTYKAIKRGMDLQAAIVVAGPTDLLYNLEYRGEGMEEVYRDLVGDPTGTQKRSRHARRCPGPRNCWTSHYCSSMEQDARVRVDHAR